MSPWWLLVIVPASEAIGAVVLALIVGSRPVRRRIGKDGGTRGTDGKPQRKAGEPVTLRARRDIPLDVWMDKIAATDAKTAAAWLQLSMAQQLASAAAPHVAVGYVYDEKTQVYRIFADLQVVPLEDRK